MLSPYRSPEERDTRLGALANRLGAELRSLGASVEGRALTIARVPPTGRAPAAAVLVCAGIHGLEYIGTEVALGFLEALAEPSAELARLRARAEIWVLPSLNPDGYARTWERDGQGALKSFRTNAHGVDLNRNFPLPGPQRPVLTTLRGWRTGSDDPGNAFYRGPRALSEPEASALATLLGEVRFAASANLHSTWGMLIPPCIESREHRRAYRALCGSFARAQPGARYRRLMAGGLDRFTGEQEDYQHHVLDTWALCIEHYPIWVNVHRFRGESIFRRFNPPDPRPWIANDLPGLVAYFHAALDLGPPSAHYARRET